MVEPGGEYCAAFSSTWASAEAVRRGSSRTGTSGSTLTVDAVLAQGVLDLVARGRDDLGRVRRDAPRWPRRRRRDAPSRGCSGTAACSRSTSARMRSLCSRALVGSVRRAGLQVGGGDADGRQRRPQVVAERGQQRRLQLLALPGQLAGLALLEELRPLDRRWRRRRRARRACRARRAGPPRPAGRSAWCRRAAAPGEPSRPSLCHRPVAGVGAGVGVELERGLGRRERRGQLPGVERHRRAGVEDVPFVAARQRDGHVVEVEPPRDRPGQRRERLAAVGADQHVAAQVEEAGQLVAPAHRLAGPRSRDRRQVAGHEADGEERRPAPPSSAGRRW